MSQIAIILPTYNVQNYIARALDSCIAQTLKDIEIIVVDDCGSDRSVDIAREYAARDNRIKIVCNKENLKLLKARYEGVKIAVSPYVMFLDPDDFLEIDACEKFLKSMRGGGEAELVVANHNIIEHGIKVKKDYWQFGEPFRAEYLRRLMIDDVAGKWNIWGKIFKTNTLKKVYENLKLPDEIKITMAEDALVTLNFMKYVEKIKTIPCILYNYNLDNIGSSTNDVEPLKIKNNIQDLNICIKMIDNLNNCINSELKLFARYIINCLQMHRTSLEYLLEKNHFLRLFLRLKRKRIKIEKSRILSKVY